MHELHVFDDGNLIRPEVRPEVRPESCDAKRCRDQSKPRRGLGRDGVLCPVCLTGSGEQAPLPDARAQEGLNELALENQECDQKRRDGHDGRRTDHRNINPGFRRAKQRQADGQRPGVG